MRPTGFTRRRSRLGHVYCIIHTTHSATSRYTINISKYLNMRTVRETLPECFEDDLSKYKKGNSCCKKKKYDQYFTVHAEVNVLFTASRAVKAKKKNRKMGGTMYVTRVLRKTEDIPLGQDNWFGNAKPCPLCARYMYSHGINTIKYTDIIDGENVLVEMKAEEAVTKADRRLLACRIM